jgi:acetyltransferase
LELNPLIADVDGVLAVDSWLRLRAVGETGGGLAITPYPAELAEHWATPDGERLMIRPIRPEDADQHGAFFHRLSPQDIRYRFFTAMRELSLEQMARLTQIDYDREMAFIATLEDQGAEREIGVVRYITNPDGESCEFALAVADEWQRRGLGRRMMTLLIDVARARGLREMIGHVLAENRGMLGLAESLGFVSGESSEGPQVRRVLLVLQPR